MSIISIPAPFEMQLRRELNESEVLSLIEALDGEATTAIRVNPYKMTDPDEVVCKWGAAAESVPWSRYGFYLTERPQFTYDSAFHAGAYYVQEASSQFVGHILSGEDLDGVRLLDSCAAPGGKTTLYSTLVGHEGLVVAAELNRGRASVLADNVRKWGLGNVVVVNSDAKQLSAFESFYDVVAVDAPCSGEGMFRKMEVAREEWSEGNVALCVERQRDILQGVWRTLKAGGTLIYSTCTFNRAENEEVLEWFEQWTEGEVVEYDDVECGDDWGVECGRVGAFQTFRFFPSKARGEGFFVAVARKGFDAGGRVRMPKGRKAIFSSLSRGDVAECSRWVEQPERMSFYLVGDTIYGYYTAQMDGVKRLAESLNVIYSGVAMGQIFKGKLSPDGALALFAGVNREAAAVAELDEQDIITYLRRGEVAADRFEEGINLVVDLSGYAVGYVKRIGARVNNRYLNSLKILK
ncbi:MAG: RsmB/NOP family class I SAM-dependent RNA methyltransferase [Rikenellaceae bacterium]